MAYLGRCKIECHSLANWPPLNQTHPSGTRPVWPDLAKCRPFGGILKVFGNIWEFIEYLTKVWPYFAKTLCYCANFHCSKTAKYWTNSLLAIWSHCTRLMLFIKMKASTVVWSNSTFPGKVNTLSSQQANVTTRVYSFCARLTGSFNVCL